MCKIMEVREIMDKANCHKEKVRLVCAEPEYNDEDCSKEWCELHPHRPDRAPAEITVYRSVAIIGVAIKANKLFNIKKKKLFDHQYGEDFKFCPKTGRECWTTERKPKFDFLVDLGYGGEESIGSGIQALDMGGEDGDNNTTNRGAEDAYVYIGEMCSADLDHSTDVEINGRHGFTKVPDNLQTIKDKVKKFTEDLGLWDERDFGMYSLILSYC